MDRPFKNDEGKYDVDYIDFTAWKGTAEFLSKWVVKGDLLAVAGRLQNRDWTDKDGNKRRSAEVQVDSVKNLTFKKENANPTPAEPAPKPKAAKAKPVESSVDIDPDEVDGELPF